MAFISDKSVQLFTQQQSSLANGANIDTGFLDGTTTVTTTQLLKLV